LRVIPLLHRARPGLIRRRGIRGSTHIECDVAPPRSVMIRAMHSLRTKHAPGAPGRAAGRRSLAMAVALALTSAAMAAGVGYAIWMAMGPTVFPGLSTCAARYGFDAQLQALRDGGPAPEAFRFVVLGDSRGDLPVALEVYRRAKDEDPAFIVSTGDVGREGSADEYLEAYASVLEALEGTPAFHVPGNHDRGVRRDYAAFRYLFGEETFSFIYGDCQFIGLNVSETVRLSREELEMLEKELKESDARYRFVFMHIPPRYVEAELVADARRGFTVNSAALRALLRRYRVTDVFVGHIHGYGETEIDGVRYTLTAGAGAPLSEQLPEPWRVYNYVVVHVSPEAVRREVVLFSREDDDWVRRETPYSAAP